MELWSPRLQRFYEDWEAWRRGRPFPSRKDFDAVPLLYMQGHVTVVDVFYNPTRFFFRLHARASAEHLGIDLTGKFLESVREGHLRARMQQTLLTTLRKRAPHAVSYFGRPAEDFRTGDLEVLSLPFSSDGQTIDMIAYGTHFDLHKEP